MKKAGIGLKNRTLGFIGMGRVGYALMVHCLGFGYRISGIYDVDQCRAWPYGRKFRVRLFQDPRLLVRESDVVFFTVPDREIERVYLSVRGHLRPGTVLVHCAGAFGTETFIQTEQRHLGVLALHPIQSFFSPEQAVRDLPGSYFAVDGNAFGLRVGRELIRKLRGKAIVIKSKDRALYHAMCVFVSNFINVIFFSGERIGERLGFSSKQTRRILGPLALTTLRNIVNEGARQSLTGPVIRGDKGTVNRHLKALRAELPELAKLYQVLNRYLKQLMEIPK